MKELLSTITINRPVAEVFAFFINPANTPRWVAAITHEEASNWPVRGGTVYRNQRSDGIWAEYLVATYEPDKQFVLHQMKDGFSVGYDLQPTGENTMTLTYSIWNEDGNLPATLKLEDMQNILNMLRKIMERTP